MGEDRQRRGTKGKVGRRGMAVSVERRTSLCLALFELNQDDKRSGFDQRVTPATQKIATGEDRDLCFGPEMRQACRPEAAMIDTLPSPSLFPLSTARCSYVIVRFRRSFSFASCRCQCPVHLPKTVLEVRSYLDSASTLFQVVLETIGVHVPLSASGPWAEQFCTFRVLLSRRTASSFWSTSLGSLIPTLTFRVAGDDNRWPVNESLHRRRQASNLLELSLSIFFVVVFLALSILIVRLLIALHLIEGALDTISRRGRSS